jgi:hypothetical protein
MRPSDLIQKLAPKENVDPSNAARLLLRVMRSPSNGKNGIALCCCCLVSYLAQQTSLLAAAAAYTYYQSNNN